MNPSAPNTWLVAGASGGLGEALVNAILERGDRVAATFRSAEAAAAFEHAAGDNGVGIVLDVRQAERIPDTIAQAASRLGHIDVLINNAGHGQFGAIEDVGDQRIRELFETNFFGLLNVTRAVLPYMRDHGGGRIANISSAAGFQAVASAGIYSATKFAVEGMSEALAGEVKPFGISVTIVEPGAFRTRFATTSMDLEGDISPPYQPMLGPILHYLTKIYPGTEMGDPIKGAGAIVAALTSVEPPLRLVLGEDALAAVRAKIEQVKADLAAWETLTLSTGFDK
jgi:NAD(P)-dependent dehydrogenase (short-subunit alcohol dehydrogenase family)